MRQEGRGDLALEPGEAPVLSVPEAVQDVLEDGLAPKSLEDLLAALGEDVGRDRAVLHQDLEETLFRRAEKAGFLLALVRGLVLDDAAEELLAAASFLAPPPGGTAPGRGV